MSGTLTKVTGLMGRSLQSYLARGGSFYLGDFAFDSAYPMGGESIDFPFDPSMVIAEPRDGYVFEWDYTNEKLKAYRPGPSLIVEEVVTVASNVGNLKHKPFYIIAIEPTAGSTTGPFNAIPTGKTPLTTECAVTFTDGTLTFLAGDAVTSARVTYIPQQLTGPFSAGNLVIDEEVTAAAAKADLANQAGMVQYVYDGTDGVRCVLEPVGEAPTATHNAVIDIDDGSSATNIDSHADDEGNTLLVTYIKYSAFAAAMWRGDSDITLAAEIYNWNTNDFSSLVVPGLGTQVVGEQTATNVELIWSGPSASLGAGVPVWDPRSNLWSTNEGTAINTLSMPALYLSPLVARGMVEAGVGEDLSSVNPKVQAWRI